MCRSYYKENSELSGVKTEQLGCSRKLPTPSNQNRQGLTNKRHPNSYWPSDAEAATLGDHGRRPAASESDSKQAASLSINGEDDGKDKVAIEPQWMSGLNGIKLTCQRIRSRKAPEAAPHLGQMEAPGRKQGHWARSDRGRLPGTAQRVQTPCVGVAEHL